MVGNVRIGDTVGILQADRSGNRLRLEGYAAVMGSTAFEHHYWVRFVGKTDLVLRCVDPVAQLVGAERYLALVNPMIAAAGDARQPPICSRGGASLDDGVGEHG